jgi:hypothetical protein
MSGVPLQYLAEIAYQWGFGMDMLSCAGEFTKRG